MCAIGVVTTRQSLVVAYLRVSEPQAAYERVTLYYPRLYSQQNKSLVTASIIKSDAVPALRAGAVALFSGGSGDKVADVHGRGLEVLITL